MINPEFDQLLVDQLWLRVTGGEPWTVEQIEENKTLEDFCKRYLANDGDEKEFRFIQDEAQERGLDVDVFCNYIISEGIKYRRLVNAVWRARQMLTRYIELNPNTEQEDVAALIESRIEGIIDRYVTQT